MNLIVLFSVLSVVNTVRWKDDECLTNCIPYKNYHYCYTSWTSWKKCDILREEDKIYEFYYPTNKNDIWCSGRCYDGWCFTEGTSSWEHCDNHDSHIINKTFLNEIERSTINNKHCSNSFSSIPIMKFKRSIEDYDVNVMARLMQENNNGFTTLTFSNLPTTSIISFSTMNAPPLPNHENVQLTVRIEARIRYSHLQRRTAMPNTLNIHMRNMDSLSVDERGHLIAASLGGTNDPFNIVPQYRGTNRRYGSFSHWYTIEGEIRDFIRYNPEYTASLHVIVLYGDLSISRRPTGFLVQAILYDENESIYRDSGSCYFTNNPDGPSLNEPDLGFDHRDRDELKRL